MNWEQARQNAFEKFWRNGKREFKGSEVDDLYRQAANEMVVQAVNQMLVQFDVFIAQCKTFEDDDFVEGQIVGAASMKAYCAQILDELAE